MLQFALLGKKRGVKKSLNSAISYNHWLTNSIPRMSQTMHAEVHALKRLEIIANEKKDNKSKRIKNINLFVCRFSLGSLQDSKPCTNCINYMCKFSDGR